VPWVVERYARTSEYPEGGSWGFLKKQVWLRMPPKLRLPLSRMTIRIGMLRSEFEEISANVLDSHRKPVAKAILTDMPRKGAPCPYGVKAPFPFMSYGILTEELLSQVVEGLTRFASRIPDDILEHSSDFSCMTYRDFAETLPDVVGKLMGCASGMPAGFVENLSDREKMALSFLRSDRVIPMFQMLCAMLAVMIVISEDSGIMRRSEIKNDLLRSHRGWIIYLPLLLDWHPPRGGKWTWARGRKIKICEECRAYFIAYHLDDRFCTQRCKDTWHNRRRR
jgi:hypothetical protein